MPIADALRTLPDGVCINVDVSPNAKCFQIQGYNQWRKRIEVRVSSPAQKGAANEELTRKFSSLLNIPPQTVSIHSGSTTSKKTLKIHNISIDKVLKILQEILTNG
jgi:hypothetical protein